MGRTFKYLKTYRGLLEELFRVQVEKDQAEQEENEMLVRLFELDTVRIRERLKVNPCDICYYGHLSVYPKTCELWSRCLSSVKLEHFREVENWVEGEFSLLFKLEDNEIK